MPWQALILLHALFGAFMTLQSRALARKKQTRHASMAINAIAFSVLFVIGVLFVLLSEPINWTQVSRYWPHMAAAGFSFAFYSVYMYRALAYMESANVSVVMTVNSIFTMIIAGVMLGERMSVLQLVGTGLLLPSIWYVLLLASREKRDADIRKFARLKGFGYALTASFALAVGTSIEKYTIDHMTPSSYIGVAFAMQMVAAWLLVLLFRRHTLGVLKDTRVLAQAVRLGALRSVAGIAFLYSLIGSNSASLTSVVANFRIIIVTILAAIILKEKDNLYQKLLASAAAFVALGIIFWN